MDLYEKLKASDLMMLAEETNDSALLRELSTSRVEGVAQRVARNPYTPLGVLLNLSQRDEWYIRENVARNPKAKEEMLARLSEDESEEVRLSVANNLNTPVDILLKLANDSSHHVLVNLASNLSLPEELVKELAHSKNIDVRENIAANKTVKLEHILHMYFHDELHWVDISHKLNKKETEIYYSMKNTFEGSVQEFLDVVYAVSK